MKVSEVFIETLAEAGVKRVYGVTGDSLNGITDAIRRNKQIEWMHMRHEEAAAFAAGAESQLTGELAVCAGSCGPGNLHLINGLYDCHRSRVPVLAIAAQIPSQEIGSGYFQETHPEHLFKDCSHYCELVSQAGADAARAGDRDAHRHRPAGSRGGCDPRRRCCSGNVPILRWRSGSIMPPRWSAPRRRGARPGGGLSQPGAEGHHPGRGGVRGRA